MTWIERDLETRLAAVVRTRPILVLTGARQTGKTSLLRKMLPSFDYVSLDLPSEAESADRDPDGFLARHPPPVFIDEVQYAPGIFRHVKVVVDRDRSRSGQFLLTGSQKFTLMQEVSESLAGRAEIVELESLSVREIVRAVPGPTPQTIMLRGGLPELYSNPEIDAYAYYRSYIATYLERDVRTVLNVTSLRDFERFLRACALRTARMLNKAELARDVGISPSTANQWLAVLESSGQVVLLEPWHSNQTKSLVKTPKLYLADTGVLAALLNIRSEEELLLSPILGFIWETLVFAELRKRERARSLHWSIHYWDDRTREVDFMIDRGGRLELFEAKWTSRPSPGDVAGLEHAAARLGKRRLTSRTVVCRLPHPVPVTDSVQAIPITAL